MLIKAAFASGHVLIPLERKADASAVQMVSRTLAGLGEQPTKLGRVGRFLPDPWTFVFCLS